MSGFQDMGISLLEIAHLWWVRIAGVFVLLLLAGLLAGFRVNVSRSLPPGIYQAVGGSSAVRRGSIVIVCLPRDWAAFALQRGITGPGQCDGGSYGLGKIVVAVPGDVVELREEGIIVNQKLLPNSRPLSRDSHGRSLPRPPIGSYRLRRNQIWLFSPYHHSAFDSRYFGPLSISHVQSVVRPVIVRRTGHISSPSIPVLSKNTQSTYGSEGEVEGWFVKPLLPRPSPSP